MHWTEFSISHGFHLVKEYINALMAYIACHLLKRNLPNTVLNVFTKVDLDIQW